MSSVVIKTEKLASNSNLAGFHWWDGSSLNSRHFYQRDNGKLRAIYNGDDYDDMTTTAETTPKMGTPLSSIFYNYNGIKSRTFFLNQNNQVCCISVDGTATLGVIKDPSGNAYTARPDSQLATFMWVPPNSAPHLRVAFQRPDNAVQQINHDGYPNTNGDTTFTFTVSNTSPPTVEGTGLAFLNQGPKYLVDQYFRGYYQYSDQIMELVNEPPSWIGSFTQQVQGKPQIRAAYPIVSPGKDFGRAKGPVYVYWTNPDGTISKRVRDNNGNWSNATALPTNIKVSGGGFLPIVYCASGAQSPIKERIYWNAGGGVLRMQEL